MASIKLSFDDGPGPSTLELLGVLCDGGCEATFFLLGKNLESHLPVAARMVREGHILGNHTYSHAVAGALSDEALAEEIARTDLLIREAYRNARRAPPRGIPLRLPYGVQAGDRRLRVIADLGRSHVGWTAIFQDWRRPTPPAESLALAMLRHIVERVSQGRSALLCLHDSSRHGEARPVTVEAVRLLLRQPDYRALVSTDAFASS
jgi:peptidoglycan-N-acetylglucosamine deacetylase